MNCEQGAVNREQGAVIRKEKEAEVALDRWDGMIAAGCGAVVIGIGLMSVPAAVIVGGVLLIIGGFLGAARKASRKAKQ